MEYELATISTGYSAKLLDFMQQRLDNLTPIQSQQEYRMMTIIMMRHMSENGGTVFLGTHLRVQRQVQRSRSSSFKIHIWTCRQSRPLNFLICYIDVIVVLWTRLGLGVDIDIPGMIPHWVQLFQAPVAGPWLCRSTSTGHHSRSFGVDEQQQPWHSSCTSPILAMEE
jgi:hypothetical protein